MTALALELVTDDQLSAMYATAAAEDQAEILAEADRRDKRDARARRYSQHPWAQADAEWEAAAWAQYQRAQAYCVGYLLNDRGQRQGGEFALLWQGGEERARLFATDELLTFWDYVESRTPPPGAFRAAWQAREEEIMAEDLEANEEAIEAEIDAIDAGEPARFPTFADDSHRTLPREWNWQDRLPRGKVVLIAGWRECGKGLVGWNLAAAVTNGWLLPGETADPERIAAGLSPKEPGSVLGVWDEDDRNEDNSPRADAAGADRSRVTDLTELPGGTPFELSALKGDMGNIPELLAELRLQRAEGRNPRLVILDPLDNLVMTGSHMSKQGATRLIRRLEFVARRTGVTIVIFHHLVEDGKGGKIGASSKLVDVPRWVYRIERDEEAPELWTLRKYKGNVGNPDPVRYRLVKDGDRSRIEWVGAEDVQAEERAWRQQDAPAQNRIMLALSEQQGRSLGRLATMTGTDKRTLSVLLNTLKAKGLARNVARGVWARTSGPAPDPAVEVRPGPSGYGVIAAGGEQA